MPHPMPRVEPLPRASVPGSDHNARARVPGLAALAAVLGVSFLLAFPAIRFGIPYGHDAVEHYWWYRCFAMQLWAGEWYPRWLLEMNSGLGSPVLFVYGPLPYYIAAAFRIFTFGPGREMWELGISIWLALALSGLAAYLWLKEMAGGRLAASLAAILYMAVPYHLKTDLYTRSALAEFWAFAWMPLILYFNTRLIRRRTAGAVIGLGVSYALLIATHLFTMLMFSAVPLLQAAFLCRPRERVRALVSTGSGLLLGIALSAVYLAPALANQKYISPYRLVATRPELYSFDRNFLFQGMSSNPLLHTISWLTLWTAAVAAGFFLAVPPARGEQLRRASVYWALVAAASFLIMLPTANPLWRLIPPLRAIQFPWRFNTVLALATAALAALALESIRRARHWRKIVLGAGAFLLAAGWGVPLARSMGYQHRWTPDNGPDNLDYLITAWAQATDPRALTFPEVRRLATQHGDNKAFLDQGGATAEEWQPRAIRLRINASAETWMVVKQFYFPGWMASLADGTALPVRASQPEGLLQLRVPAGDHEVRLSMPRQPAENAGAAISAMSLVMLTLFACGALAKR